MTHHLLCFCPNGDRNYQLPWKEEIEQNGCCLLTACQLHEAQAYCRAYPLVLAYVRFGEVTAELTEVVRKLKDAIPEGKALPLVGLHAGPLTASAREELCEAGMADFVALDDPGRLVLWQIETLSLLADLSRFAQSRMDVVQLAKKTREHLHDMSQPLSAVQGRLQLLQARASEDDPNARYYGEMVRLITETTQQMAEIQQLHRTFS